MGVSHTQIETERESKDSLNLQSISFMGRLESCREENKRQTSSFSRKEVVHGLRSRTPTQRLRVSWGEKGQTARF